MSVNVGDRFWDKDHRVVSQFVEVVAIEGEHAVLRRGRGRYVRTSKVRLDRIERRFVPLDERWEVKRP